MTARAARETANHIESGTRRETKTIYETAQEYNGLFSKQSLLSYDPYSHCLPAPDLLEGGVFLRSFPSKGKRHKETGMEQLADIS